MSQGQISVHPSKVYVQIPNKMGTQENLFSRPVSTQVLKEQNAKDKDQLINHIFKEKITSLLTGNKDVALELRMENQTLKVSQVNVLNPKTVVLIDNLSKAPQWLNEKVTKIFQSSNEIV